MNDAAVAQKHDGTEYLTMMSMKAVFGVEHTDRHGCNILRGLGGGLRAGGGTHISPSP